MPRHRRLDALNTVHHVMVWGIERTILFRDDTDRADFVARLAAVAEQGAWTVYAWALLPNYAHLLVRTERRPLPRSMRSVLTCDAGAFNRDHHRVGHLFQNRYKSIVVEGVLGRRTFVAVLWRTAAAAAPGSPTSGWSASDTPAAPSR
jgi:REP element-mobilizing transposase RayT